MQNKKGLIAIFVLLLAFGFFGLPVPDWLAAAVNSVAGTIVAIVAGFSKLIAFIQIFVHF